MIQGSDSRRDRMKARTFVVCACAIFMVFLVVETWCAPKSKAAVRNWGPQSMLYLKGRYGRRYASDNEEQQYYKLNLDHFSYLSSTPMKFLNIRRRFTAPNMAIKYLE